LFRIREFSQLTRVSIKALRHYDRLGLLVPAFVDPRTRYRHYAARQAPRLYQILALRELGFPLAHITEILAKDPRARSLQRLLERRRSEIRNQLEFERQRLAHVEAALLELENGHRGHPALRPVLRELPPMRVATRRSRVRDLDHGSQALFEAVEADAARARIRVPGPPVLIYHDRDHRESDADIEAGVPVVSEARSAGRSTIRALAAVPRAACVVYMGDSDRWAWIVRELLAWLQRRRLAPAGPTREMFLQFGAAGCEHLRLPRAYLADHPEDFVTEMQIPVRRALRSGG
jgi:DNA-binding transcriptional MerR regulator